MRDEPARIRERWPAVAGTNADGGCRHNKFPDRKDGE
jgi:hypothetical protein